MFEAILNSPLGISLLMAVVFLVFVVVFLIYKYVINDNNDRVFNIRKELQSVLDRLDPVALMDSHGKVIRVNAAFAKILNLGFADIIQKNMTELWKGVALAERMDAFEKIQRIHRAQHLWAQKFEDKSFNIDLYPIETKGSEYMVVEVWRDVTRIAQSNKMLQIQKEQIEQKNNQLEDKHKELIAYQKTIETRLAEKNEEYLMAQEIQQGLLPKTLPSSSEIQFSAVYKPISRVGGDLYDVVDLGDHRYAFFMGDVAGHGLPAAFICSLVKMALTMLMEKSHDPLWLMKELNRKLFEVLKPGQYLTAFLGVIDLNENILTSVRAGHPQPLLIRRKGESEWINGKGMLLGAFENGKFEKTRHLLQAGDRLYLFTDGCWEIGSSGRKKMNYKEFFEQVKNMPEVPLEHVFQTMESEFFNKFGENLEFEDDRTFLGIEVRLEPRVERLDYTIRFRVGEKITRKRISNRFGMRSFLTQLQSDLTNNAFGHGDIHRILESVEQVILNALEHGHHWSEDKKVAVLWTMHQDFFKMTVRDHGDGFNPQEKIKFSGFVQNPGRGGGLFLVQTYMDELYFDCGGSAITLIKHKKNT